MYLLIQVFENKISLGVFNQVNCFVFKKPLLTGIYN